MKFFVRIIIAVALVVFGLALAYIFLFDHGDKGTQKPSRRPNVAGPAQSGPGGRQPVEPPRKGPKHTFYHTLHFFNSNEGIVMGVDNGIGCVVTTKDGGKSWDSKTIEGTYEIHDLCFVDDKTGFASGFMGYANELYFLKTTNGGKKWELLPAGPFKVNRCFAIHFTDEKNGWMVGLTGGIFATTNGGTSWTEQASGTTKALRDVYFVDKNTGWAIGDLGHILKTTDGGKSWSQQNCETKANLKNVYMLDKNNGIISGLQNTFLHTVNGGKTWQLREVPLQRNLQGISMLDKDNCWISGFFGSIMIVTNNFKDYKVVYTEARVILESLQFVDKNNGWVVGDRGTILYSSNGGINWTVQKTSTDES